MRVMLQRKRVAANVRRAAANIKRIAAHQSSCCKNWVSDVCAVSKTNWERILLQRPKRQLSITRFFHYTVFNLPLSIIIWERMSLGYPSRR
jgi:hypothetical protein